MISLRQLKLLGVALLALTAISAGTASGAQAGTFTAGAYPAKITGAPSFHFFFTQLGMVVCRPAFQGELTGASEELTLTPVFESIFIFSTTCEQSSRETHVTTNGCDYRMRAGKEVEAGKVAGTMDIVCPEGKSINYEVTGYSPVCNLTVPPQEGLTGVPGSNPNAYGIFFKNETANRVHLQINPGGIRYVLSGGCPVTGEFTSGVYSGNTSLTAKYKEEETSLSVDG